MKIKQVDKASGDYVLMISLAASEVRTVVVDQTSIFICPRRKNMNYKDTHVICIHVHMSSGVKSSSS